MTKLDQTFESICSLYKTLYFFTLHPPSSDFRKFVIKSTKTSSFSWIFLYRNTSFTKTTDSGSSLLLSDWNISLFLISSILHISQPFHYVCCWRRSQLRASMKALLLPLNNSSNARKFCFFVPFLFFFCFFRFLFFFWPIKTTTKNWQALTHSNPSISTNQVTLSNEHMNSFFWA